MVLPESNIVDYPFTTKLKIFIKRRQIYNERYTRQATQNALNARQTVRQCLLTTILCIGHDRFSW